MKENLREEACQVRREYLREWRKRNPERVREANRRYWERKAKLKRKKEGRGDEQ